MFSLKSRPSSLSRKMVTRKLRLEALEDRRLMAIDFNNAVVTTRIRLYDYNDPNISANVSNGTLYVNGNDQANNIAVAHLDGKISVRGVGSFDAAGISRVQIQGFGGNDTIRCDGLGFNDSWTRTALGLSATIFGGDGDDYMVGGLGNDSMYGGLGNDTMHGMDGNDWLFGDAGNDYLYGTNGASDYLNGGTDNDYLSLGSGNGTASGDLGLDTVHGGYGAGISYLYGGNDRDLIYGHGNQSVIYAGAGNDYINSYSYGTTWAYGEAGDDLIYGGYGQNVLKGGDGNDTLYGWSSNTNWVYGENGNDYIVGGSGQNVLYGGEGDDTVKGNGTGTNWVYGENGNDKCYGGTTGASYVYGGYGNDKLYAGRGYSVLRGEAGDDTLVSIGGSRYDQLYGGDGFDTFWKDSNSTEVVQDASYVEAIYGTIHNVGSFYGGVSLERLGQNLTDPNAYDPRANNNAGYTPGSSNFSSRPLFATSGPGMNDIVQGQVGDCYFLAGLSGTAMKNPFTIKNSVVELGDGTYAVMYKNGSTTTFVRVDGDLPVYQNTTSLYYANTGAQGSIWVAIMEKAFAFFRTGANSYNSLHGGGMQEPFRALGGSSIGSVWGSSATQTLNNINAALAAGKQVSVLTPNADPTNGAPLVRWHVYTVSRVNYAVINGVSVPVSITLRNPWGTDGAGNDGVNDAYVTVTASQFFNYCVGADAAYV